MENIAQSGLVPVQNLDDGSQKSSDQSLPGDHSVQVPNSTDVSGCCRLCCNEDSHLRELFAGGYKEELLVRKIFECTTVEITFISDPDALICYSCVAKIEEFHHYREQCRTNDVLHRNWKRRLGGQIATASSLTILPAKYIKKEKDTESFEINADNFFPVDTPLQSDGAFGIHGPIASVADSSSAVNASCTLNERDGGNSPEEEEEEEEENLLELMPERTQHGFSFSYTNDNDEFADHNDIDCDVPIKEEVPDFDESEDIWNDFDDDISMSHTTALIPLMESSSYSTSAVDNLDAQRPFREVYNGDALVCLVQDGFLYIQKGKRQWHCRVEDCAAAITRHEDGKELESNDILHTHNREVENSATDMEILQLLKNSPSNQNEAGPDGDDEPFHYVTNIRQGNSIVFKGYRYSMKHTRRDGTIFWKCRALKGTCPAGLFQSANNEFETVETHSHEKQEPTLGQTQQKLNVISDVAVELPTHMKTKIKLLVGQQTGVPERQSHTPPSNGEENDVMQINQNNDQGVVRKGYGYKIVKNANGRPRLHFDGNLYVRESSTRAEETNGVVVWRCRRNYDMCGVVALLHPDGLVEIIGNHDHSSLKKSMKIPENMSGTRAYELLPTWKGGEALLLDGYRFLKAYSRTNGMCLWRCAGSLGVVCRVKVTTDPDGLAYISKNEKHLHDRPKRSNKSPSKGVDNSLIKIKQADKENKSDKKAAHMGNVINNKASSPVRKMVNLTRKSNDRAATSVSKQVVKVMSKATNKQTARNYRIIRNKKGNKALVYGGFRYCKIRTRQDGSICWVCRMNKKTCRAGVYQYPDGRFEWINERRHNHSPTDATEQLAPLPAPPPAQPSKKSTTQVAKKSLYHIDDETFVNSEWYLVRNRKNGATLIHAGYRYHKKASRSDNTSMWRCSQANHGCRAAIVMYSNETIAKLEDVDHDHLPPTSIKGDEDIIFNEHDESKESLNTSKDTSTTGLRIVNLNRCIEEKDDPEANMRSLLNSTLDISDEPNNEMSKKIVLPAAEAHYRYVKNRRHTKSLVFRGYRYSRSTMRERSDGAVKWVCQMNKKTCRVSVKIFKDGSLEMHSQKHNHLQLPEDMDDNITEDDEDYDVNSSTWEETFEEHKNEILDKQIVTIDKKEHDFYFALNRANGESLIFQRNRFSKDYTRPDGSTIWRCMVRQACIGRAIVYPDNTCSMYRNTYHNHPPLDILPPPLRYPDKASPSTSTTEQSLPPALAAEIQDASDSLIVKGDTVIYKQNRMKKTKSFPDGTAVFACAELESCKSLVKLQLEPTEGENSSSSSPVILFEWPHNHPNVLTTASHHSKSLTQKAEDGPQKSPIKMPRQSSKGITKCNREYQLYKSDRGHITLVYKGYRFSLRSHNNVTHGTSWKCRANRTCNAFVTFTKEGEVVRTGNGKPKIMPHNHPINGEFIERAVPLELGDLDPPAENLGVFAAHWLNGMYSGMLGGKPTNTAKASERIDRHKIIHHKNFSYKLQTIKNGRECWRCTMFQTRACRAALFCHKNGNIVECTNGRPHNHEANKSRSDAQQEATTRIINDGPRAKTTATETAVAVYHGPEKSSNQDTKLQPSDEYAESPTPAYQIVQKDGINILHYEKHRYVALNKRETIDKPRRWRCCLFNSRHQCPVELTILSTGELHFETDLTHNHRPPPAEPVEMERSSSTSNGKGTRKYQLMGRSESTVFYKGYKFFWKERRDGMAHYNCICNVSHACAVSVKIDSNGLLFECSNASHNHEALLDDSRLNISSQCTPEEIKHETKAVRQWTVTSKQARLEKCSKIGSSDYSFVRSSQGVSMLFEGHRFWFHSKLSCGLHIYRCRYQKTKDCIGSVYLDSETNLLHHRYDAEHNHEPEVVEDNSNKETVNDVVDTPDISVCTKTFSKNGFNGTNEKHDESFERGRHYTDVPKKERLKKEVTITEEYSFVKDKYSKNQLLYEDYVFEFLASHYRNNGSKFYSCLYSECSASIKLLSSGSLKVLTPIHHAHERPDLTDYRDVGRGSENFRSLPTATGSKPVILFEGHRYCATTSKTQPDNTTTFYCHRKVSSTTKNDLQERCSASLELLPNGRVIADGIHQHLAQSQPTRIESDTLNSSESSRANLMVLEGRSYRYYDKQRDGTPVWICADDPKCMAKIYRSAGGKCVPGKTKHVLRHSIPKLVDPLSTVSKVPAACTTTPLAAPSEPLPIPSSSGNLRTKWFEGNRYNFYLTRRDGIQYWRCSRRMEDKCDAGILCYPSGTILPSNNIPHTHPKIESTSSKSLNAPHQKVLPDEGPSVRQNAEHTSLVLIKSDPNAGARKSQYEILNKDERKKMRLMYKGVQFMLRHRRSDGLWIYRCRNKWCTYTVLMTKSGKIIPKTSSWHSCENPTQNNNEIASKSISFTSLSDMSSDKPEIEDPEDLIDQNDSTELSTTKRIRLDSSFVELEQALTIQQNSREDVDKDHQQSSSSESESSDVALEPVACLSNLSEGEQGEEIIEESCNSRIECAPGAEKPSRKEWDEGSLEQNDECGEASVNANDEIGDLETENGTYLPSKELSSGDNPCTSSEIRSNDTEDNDSNTGNMESFNCFTSAIYDMIKK
uniref:ZAD domain-containing protein n=1 Tax=Anopheles christyi TaxID=43041 RepID=A0A182JR90_9DIPT